MTEFHPILKDKEFYKKILNQISTERILLFSPQSQEIEKRNPDENYPIKDRFGFSSEDINVIWTPSFIEYFKDNINAFKEGYNFFLEEKNKTFFKKVQSFFKAFSFVEFTFNWTGWFWVVDSLDSISHDIVIEKSRKINKQSKTKFDYFLEVSKISYEERIKYVNKNYIKVNNNMWISESDPACLIYDPINKPYGLKDGWTTEQIGEILSEWFFVMTSEKVISISK